MQWKGKMDEDECEINYAESEKKKKKLEELAGVTQYWRKRGFRSALSTYLVQFVLALNMKIKR